MEVEVGLMVVVVMTPPETNKGSCQNLEVATETVMDPDPVIPTVTATALPTQTLTTTQEIVMDEVRLEITITMVVPEGEEAAAVQTITIEVKVMVLIITTAVTATNIGATTEIAIEKNPLYTAPVHFSRFGPGYPQDLYNHHD